MADYLFPTLYALFIWWFSTGVILYLDGLPARTFRWSMAGATVLLGIGLYGLARSSTDASVGGAYLAFTSALLVWAWHEVGFLMGFVTGPRRQASPPGTQGWTRFAHAVEAILYHELAIIIMAALVLAITWQGANQIGIATFMILWLMRLSAKLNLFLGVPNPAHELLPEHLAYLKGYLRQRAMNPLFPISITASTVVTALLVLDVTAIDASPFEVAGYTFLTALMALAVIEHWFLVLPLPAATFWAWGMRSRTDPAIFGRPPIGGAVRPQPAFLTLGRRP